VKSKEYKKSCTPASAAAAATGQTADSVKYEWINKQNEKDQINKFKQTR
jgi:hypothetical protein